MDRYFVLTLILYSCVSTQTRKTSKQWNLDTQLVQMSGRGNKCNCGCFLLYYFFCYLQSTLTWEASNIHYCKKASIVEIWKKLHQKVVVLRKREPSPLNIIILESQWGVITWLLGGTFKKVVKEEEEKDYLLYWKGTCLHGGSLFSMKKHQAFSEKRTYSLRQKLWDFRNEAELSQFHGDIQK